MEIIIRRIRQGRSGVLRKNKELRRISFYILIRDEEREHADKIKTGFLIICFSVFPSSIFKR